MLFFIEMAKNDNYNHNIVTKQFQINAVIF